MDPERRDFLKGMVATGASLISPQRNPETIYRATPAWTTRHWWPIFESTAISKGLPRMFDQWWPLHMIDVLNGNRTNFHGWGQQEAHRVWRDFGHDPVQIESAGWCLAAAAVTLLEPEPVWTPRQIGEYLLERPLMEGIMVAKHAGDLLIDINHSGNSLRNLVQAGEPVIVDLPEQPGRWYRALNGVTEDGNAVLVTNYGHPDKYLPTSAIRGAWIVSHQEAPNLHPDVKAEAAGRAFRDLNTMNALSDEWVNWIIYPQ